MAWPSRKKRQDDVFGAVGGLILLVGLGIMFTFDLTNIYFFLGLILFAVVVGSVASSYVPDMRKKENRNKNPYTGLPKKSKGKEVSSTGKKKTTRLGKQSNLLRFEKEIMTLPFEELTWREFEELVYLYYKAKGYRPRRTAEGADGGVDLLIFNRHHNTEIAVQIKHYGKGKNVGVQLIRELDSAKKNHGCVLAEMITTSRFTQQARVEADRRRIECRDQEWVERKLLTWRDEQMQLRGLV